MVRAPKEIFAALPFLYITDIPEKGVSVFDNRH